MNEFILSLLHDLKEEDNLSDSFIQIAYLSSMDFTQNSIFLNPSFLLSLINDYLYQSQIEHIFIICHNIIADSYFNLELFNAIIESNYIPYFLNNYHDDAFLQMLNMLIYKTYHLNSELLPIFKDTIPFLINSINSESSENRFFCIDSLCYLIFFPECLTFALENELMYFLEKSLALANSQLFSQSLILINRIHKCDKSIYIQNAEIASQVIRHLEHADDHQIHIIIEYLKTLIIEDSKLFFELNIINELLFIIQTCSFKKKKEIVFFFSQSFSIIFNRCSQFCFHEVIENSDLVFHNTMIHSIISSIMEMCLSFNEEKCLFCLDVIYGYFEKNFEDAFLAANEVSFPQILLELASNSKNLSEDTSFLAQYIFESFFIDDEKEIKV